MTIHSRNKGANGEREVRDILRAHGFTCERDGRLDDDLQHNILGVHLEVKRREKLSIDEWWTQAVRDAGERTPIVVFRRSRQTWRAVVDLNVLLDLLKARA